MIVDLYQSLKPIISDLLSLSHDAIHIHVGFLAWIMVYLWKPKTKLLLLVPFVLSIMMECLDLTSDWTTVGKVFPTYYLHDLINTNFVPVILTFAMIKKRAKDAPSPSDSRYT